MNDFDPNSPWGERSPWDIAQPEPTAPEVPVTNQPNAVATSPNPFKIGFTLKSATGHDSEWLTPAVYGSTAEETAQRGKDLLLAMKAQGLIEFTSQAAKYFRDQRPTGTPTQAPPAAAQPSFQDGQVQWNQQAPQAPFGGGGDSCTHGRTHRDGTNAKGPWAAKFCNERNKQAQCPPLWRQKDGSFA